MLLATIYSSKILTVFTGGPSWAMNYTKHFTFTGSLCPQQTHELRISNYSHITDLATTKASREQVVCQMLQLESGGMELRTEAILVQSKPLLTSSKCLIPICMVSLPSPMITYVILLIPKDGRSYQKSFLKKPQRYTHTHTQENNILVDNRYLRETRIQDEQYFGNTELGNDKFLVFQNL